MAIQRVHPEFEEEMIKLTNQTFSAPSTPAVSRSSTPAPPDRDDDGTDDDEEDQYPQGQGSALTKVRD